MSEKVTTEEVEAIAEELDLEIGDGFVGSDLEEKLEKIIKANGHKDQAKIVEIKKRAQPLFIELRSFRTRRAS